MSVISDETDLLLLIPPNFFNLESDSDEDLVYARCKANKLLFEDLIYQMSFLEDRVSLMESKNDLGVSMYGSLERLNSTSSSRNYNGSKSVSASPLKNEKGRDGSRGVQHQRTISENGTSHVKPRSNLLTSNSYLSQKEKDGKILHEIDDYFKKKPPTPSKLNLDKNKGDSLDLLDVATILKEMEIANEELENKIKSKNVFNEDIRSRSPSPYLDPNPSNARKRLEFEECPPELSFKSACVADGQSRCRERCFDAQTQANSQCEKWRNKVTPAQESSIMNQRLEEERLRRKNCELSIQELEQQLREKTEQISAAAHVDREKDKAIMQLKEGWSKIMSHWKELEDERNELAKKVQTEASKHKTELNQMSETLTRCEIELSKALDLAHAYKEKWEAADKEKNMNKSKEKDNEHLKKQLKETSIKLREAEESCSNLKVKLSLVEETLLEGKYKYLDIQNMLKDAKKVLKERDNELSDIQKENEKLKSMLNEEKNKLGSIEQSKKSLQHLYDELKKKEKNARHELKIVNEAFEKNKIELKEFYQKQVETVVKEKLKEFQEQLNVAEQALRKEFEVKEQTLGEIAMKQLQQLADKHIAEVALLEQKHREEIDLNKIQLAQAEGKIDSLQFKLREYSRLKSDIAEKLHSVMETHWQEALKVITNTSPQSVKNNHRNSKSGGTYTVNSGKTSSNEGSSTTETPFCRDDLETTRDTGEDPLTYRINETPEKMNHNDNLRKYIQTLLERPPGFSEDSLDESNLESLIKNINCAHFNGVRQVLAESTSFSFESSDQLKCSKSNHMKPPWK